MQRGWKQRERRASGAGPSSGFYEALMELQHDLSQGRDSVCWEFVLRDSRNCHYAKISS